MTVPLLCISAVAIAKAFVDNRILMYGSPRSLSSENEPLFMSKFFQHVCRILSVEKLFSATYHPQSNGQVERFSRTIVEALRHYVADNPIKLDLYTRIRTISYNMQIHNVI